VVGRGPRVRDLPWPQGVRGGADLAAAGARGPAIPGIPVVASYQPVSYKLESRMGTREQFKDMVARCHAAGVAIYADVVINHMAGGSGTGSAGSTFGGAGHQYSFPGIYVPQQFHWNVTGARNCQASVSNYQDRHSVQECELVNLPDLATELPEVRTRIVRLPSRSPWPGRARLIASDASSTSIRLIAGHRQPTAREDRQRQLRCAGSDRSRRRGGQARVVL